MRDSAGDTISPGARTDSRGDKLPAVSVEDAIKTLEGAVRTAKGRSALLVLRNELQAGNGQKAAPASRGGFAGAKGIVRDMIANRAAGAKGGGTA